MIHPVLRTDPKCNAVKIEARLFFTVRMEICTGIDLKSTKLAMGLHLRGEITETKRLVKGIFACHKFTY